MTEEILDQMPPFVHLFVDRQGFFSLRALGDADRCPARVHLVNDPIAVESFVGKQRIERQSPDERCDAHRIIAIAREQDEPDEVPEGIRERQYLGRPTALRLAYSLTESPPFAPWPAR